ncbi:hypothetical protein [Taklimakanibacter deserti]|uniref:hypothetical protein n=1 Tax=Taklimakanibacter deserti TaxID=2267839 RepID=UPI000E653346
MRLFNRLAILGAFAAALLVPVLGILPPAPSGEAATLRATVYAGIRALYKGSTEVGTPEISLPLADPQEFTSGTGNFQSDLLFQDERTVTASSSEDLDLAGVLADTFGTTLTFVEVTAIYVEASCSNTNDVVVGAATAPVALGFGGTTPTWAIQPCGRFMVSAPKAGWTVGAGSTDDLKIANSSSGSSVTYKIVIFGRSA